MCADFGTTFDTGLTSKGELSYCSCWAGVMLSQVSPKVLPKAPKAAWGLGALSRDIVGKVETSWSFTILQVCAPPGRPSIISSES